MKRDSRRTRWVDSTGADLHLPDIDQILEEVRAAPDNGIHRAEPHFNELIAETLPRLRNAAKRELSERDARALIYLFDNRVRELTETFHLAIELKAQVDKCE